ncbi:EAL domain-containing protein [Eggerthella timonensis]|uniref:EAL domain-containing protein n=1 Tax=Eggerthella timonensis TaxID=1871008 RepID=UPI000C78E75C|nr:bifunctional diguanylate cyclase/phosphodiesterase [Eggerthella timonensis]
MSAGGGASPCYECDGLTGLETRAGFLAHVDELVSAHPRIRYVLVCVDVDRFCAYNARFGYDAGDTLLVLLSDALSRLLSPESAAARLYADRFALLVPRELLDEAVFLARFSYRPEGAFCSVRSGVYEVEGHDLDAAGMLDNALLALRAAKHGAGESRVRTYRAELRDEAYFFQDIVREFAPSLREGLISPRFQPIVSCPDNRLAGVEILARWNRVTGSYPSPARFVPVLEETGFIVELDMHMIVRALVHLREWIDAGLKAVPVSVNVSRLSLRVPDLLRRIEALLRAYRLPSRLLRLEVSERAWSIDSAQLKASLAELRDAGLSVAVDDFGAGSTSLESLAGSPVDVVKIDKVFLRTQMSERDGAVIRSLVQLAHDLGLAVTVEGVETEEQAAFLRDVGVDCAQGFLYAPPLDRASFEERLAGGGG